MAVKKEEGFILKTFVIQEADRVAVLLNQNGEKLSLVAKGGNRLKSRFSGKLEPFSFVIANYFDPDKKGLKPLNEIEVKDNLQRWIKGDMKRFLILSFLSEITDNFVFEKEQNPRLFRLIKHVVSSLKEGADYKLTLSYFIVWILKLSGLLKENYPDEISQCISSILKNPIDKVDCKENNTLFEYAISLLCENSDKDFKSYSMLKNFV